MKKLKKIDFDRLNGQLNWQLDSELDCLSRQCRKHFSDELYWCLGDKLYHQLCDQLDDQLDRQLKQQVEQLYSEDESLY
jgi:hypothetical protein